MKCHDCNGSTNVIRTQGLGEHVVTRVRKCRRCRKRWKTEEIVVARVVRDKVFPLGEPHEDVDGEPWYMEGAFKRDNATSDGDS